MKHEKMLQQMKAVTNALYLREHAKVKPILDREAKLRGQLTMLKNQIEDSRKLIEDSHEIKTIGADLQWQKWHTHARRELNRDLAQTTAKKLRAMDTLRTAFGRKHAVETMVDLDNADRKGRRAKMLQNRLMDLE